MELLHVQDLLALLSGVLVGFSLSLIGGGGSILAVPLLIYFVGFDDTHLAIGTSAAAVAASALANLASHARAGTVKWPCALVFAAFGIAGAELGSTLGKLTDGDLLLGLFGVVMIVVGAAMLWRKAGGDDPDVRLTRETMLRLLPRLVASGLAVGALSGFFGIGGGFLVVPGLVTATAMPFLNAVGSSLVSVTAFGTTTAANYALDGFVVWRMVVHHHREADHLGELLKQRKGLRIAAGYGSPVPGSSHFALTMPRTRPSPAPDHVPKTHGNGAGRKDHDGAHQNDTRVPPPEAGHPLRRAQRHS